MELKINEWERKRLIQALVCAIDYQRSLVEAHTIELYDYRKPCRVPKEFRKQVDVYLRDIEAFKRLLKKFRKES